MKLVPVSTSQCTFGMNIKSKKPLMYRLPSLSVKQISSMKVIYQWEMKLSVSATNFICSFTAAMKLTGGFNWGATKI